MVGTVNDDSTPPDDSISRIDALALIGGSMGYDEAEAADYLADCARGLLGQGRVEWTSQNEIIIDCVVGPLLQGENRPQSPGPEQLEQAIRSRLWEQARRGEPGVHVKGNSATYRAAVVFVSAFGGWQLESPPEEGVSPTGPEWLVEINFKLIKYRLSQIITVLRADGGLLEAGLERLRSLGRASPAVAAAIDPAADRSKSDARIRPGRLDPVKAARRGKTDQWVGEDARDGSRLRAYANRLRRTRCCCNREFELRAGNAHKALSRVARPNPNSGGSSLWKGLPPPKRR